MDKMLDVYCCTSSFSFEVIFPQCYCEEKASLAENFFSGREYQIALTRGREEDWELIAHD